MPRPQSNKAQFARVLDKLVANSPWLSTEEREVVKEHRYWLVKEVEREQADEPKALKGGKRRG